MNYEALPGMEDALKLVQEKKMSKEAHKKAAKAGKRWQDSDGDGKWYEKGEDVKEGVRDTDPEKGTAERKARLEKKRGMKVDDHPQYKKEEVEEVEEAEQRVKAKADKKMKVYGGPAYIKKPKNEEVEIEEDAKYDRNRKRAAQRAADRNAARAAGKTGAVPGVGYVTARKEKETYVDSAGTTRHKSGAKNEEVEIEEGMKAARDNVGASTCWKGYTAKGTKTKNGKEVPNCVPANEELEVMEETLMESGLFSDDEVRYIIGEKFDELEELYKGKHGQTEKQYQDSRSDAGKMISGDSKSSGSKYAQGRRTSSDAGAQPAGGSKKPESQGKMDRGSRIDLQFRKAALKKKEAVKNEELNVFDTVLEYLQVEGIVETVEDAEWMMVNVLEEGDVDSILDEARRSDKEGYEKGSKENPKRNDIPHGDVSQRSMLHSKLKRRANEMGRERRSSARNKAGGRTPVGKKEKAFLQAVTRTAGQVRNPNVPDTGKHNK